MPNNAINSDKDNVEATRYPVTDRPLMKDWKQPLVLGVALVGGFALSFVGFGILWAGTPWPYQFLMAFPFLLLSFGIACFKSHGPWLILAGAAPVGALLVQFRDKGDSHLMPILLVGSWVIGTLIGSYLGRRYSTNQGGVV